MSRASAGASGRTWSEGMEKADDGSIKAQLDAKSHPPDIRSFKDKGPATTSSHIAATLSQCQWSSCAPVVQLSTEFNILASSTSAP